MYTEGFEQWFKLNKNMTALSEWNKTTADMCQRVAQQNLSIMEENLTRISDQIKRASSVRKPEEWLTLQKDIINEDITAAVECAQKITHTYMENMDALTKLCGTATQQQQTGNPSKRHQGE